MTSCASTTRSTRSSTTRECDAAELAKEKAILPDTTAVAAQTRVIPRAGGSRRWLRVVPRRGNPGRRHDPLLGA